MIVEVQMENNMQKMHKALEDIVNICDGKKGQLTSKERLIIYNLANAALTTPVRKGKWENGRGYEYEYAYCSECGRMQWAGWDTHKQAEENIESFACDYKYCPGCGAEMDGGVYVK